MLQPSHTKSEDVCAPKVTATRHCEEHRARARQARHLYQRLLAAMLACSAALSAQNLSVKVDPYCGSPLNWSESVSALPLPALGVSFSAQLPASPSGALVLALAQPCAVGGFGGAGLYLFIDWIPPGANYSSSIPIPALLRNWPFVAQFVDVTSLPQFGEAYEMTVVGDPVLRGATVPVVTTTAFGREVPLYGDLALVPGLWEPIADNTPRASRLVPPAPISLPPQR